MLEARDRLIVALDLSTVAAAEKMVDRLGDAVGFYKIGYQLAFAGGLALVDTLVRSGKRVFLDLKLHDIGNTVAKGVKSVSRLGASFAPIIARSFAASSAEQTSPSTPISRACAARSAASSVALAA